MNNNKIFCIICLVSVLILIWSLSRNNFIEKFDTKVSNNLDLSETHSILLWNTNEKIKTKALNILEKYPITIKNIEDINLNGKRLNIDSGGINTKKPFTLIIFQDNNPKYNMKKTFTGNQVVNKNLYNIKSDIRGDYSNYKVSHGSFNTEETREILKNLKREHFFKRNTFNNINELFNALENVNYVVDRSFDEVHLALNSSKDIDVITDDYYKFKNIIGGVNDNSNSLEKNGYNIQNIAIVNNKNVKFDIRYVGDNYYDNKWQEDILKRRIKYKNMYIPSELDQLWMLYYHVNYQHRYRKNNKHNSTINKLENKLGIKANKENFNKFMKQNNYKVVIPNDKEVSIVEKFNTKISEGKNLKNGGKTVLSVVKNNDNTYTKIFNNPLGYNAEKNSYIRLNNNKHFPNIIHYDDNELLITLEDAGIPINNVNNIENWQQQLQEISNSLKENNIKHNDIIEGNFAVKDNILKLIDFEYAEDLSKNKQWISKDKNDNNGCREIPIIKNEQYIQDLLYNNKCY